MVWPYIFISTFSSTSVCGTLLRMSNKYGSVFWMMLNVYRRILEFYSYYCACTYPYHLSMVPYGVLRRQAVDTWLVKDMLLRQLWILLAAEVHRNRDRLPKWYIKAHKKKHERRRKRNAMNKHWRCSIVRLIYLKALIIQIMNENFPLLFLLTTFLVIMMMSIHNNGNR